MPVVFCLLVLLLPLPVRAHFQLVYSPQVLLDHPATLEFRLVFAHPLANGVVMDMEPPQAFWYHHKGQRVDLLAALRTIAWRGPDNSAAAYGASVSLKRNGDYVFVVEPTPYLEKHEDLYIQQIAKSHVNKGGLPTGWEQPLGLKTEIVPLVKPTSVLVGGTFSGQVLSGGRPVAGAQVEVEWLNGLPDVQANAFGSSRVTPPGAALVVITDANGVFTFGIPRAGTWGFGALGVGPDTHYKDKKLSQDAVLWINAVELH
ncbi:MAG: DUF4198 domain-containing protein [Magnetococcales bacterium]|nr:DUF4198 domain-containing protein [Magnetococcales bacterium]